MKRHHRFMINALEEHCVLKHQTHILEVLETDMVRLASYTDDPFILKELSQSCFDSVRRQVAENQNTGSTKMEYPKTTIVRIERPLMA